MFFRRLLSAAIPPAFIMYFDNTTPNTNSLTAAIIFFLFTSSFFTYANFSSRLAFLLQVIKVWKLEGNSLSWDSPGGKLMILL